MYKSVMAACAALVLVACAGVEIKPGTKSHARRDIPPGPGLLTGKQGEFVLFRVGGDPQEEGEPEQEGLVNEQGKREQQRQ